jgi:hypothetical protein
MWASRNLPVGFRIEPGNGLNASRSGKTPGDRLGKAREPRRRCGRITLGQNAGSKRKVKTQPLAEPVGLLKLFEVCAV